MKKIEQRYVYYKQTMSEKHFRFASEIAADVFGELGITTLTGKPPTLFVSAYLNKKLEEKGLPKLYYHSKRGLLQVFQNELDIQDSFWRIFLSPFKTYINNNKDNIVTYKINNRTYKLLVLKDAKNNYNKFNNNIYKETTYIA